MRELLRRQGYAYATESTYLDWVRRFVKFSNVQSRIEMLENAEQKVERFLTHLAIKQKVAPSTQNQAFNALLFLYEQVLEISIKNENIQALRAKKKIHIPIVLTQEEVAIVIYNMKGVYRLMLSLMYGCGLRMKELLNLRIKDIDFGLDNVYIFDSKSQSDRTCLCPIKLKMSSTYILMMYVEYTLKI